MKNKEFRSQQLLDALDTLDENTLLSAYGVEDAEAFRNLDSAQAVSAPPRQGKIHIPRYVALAGCMAVALAIALSAFLFWIPQDPQIPATQPPLPTTHTDPTFPTTQNPTIPTTHDPTIPTTMPDPVIMGGKCGENLSFTLNYDSRVLTIYGVGPMYDYDSELATPWAHDRDLIDHLIIEEGVTSISDHAFGGSNLHTVQLPESLEHVGDHAFAHCGQLLTVTLPDGIQSLGIEIFTGCHNLRHVQLPDQITVLPSGMFQNCDKLNDIPLPQSLIYIDSNAFAGCTSLQKLTFPDSVTSIGPSAFAGCSQLRSAEFGDGLLVIGSYAFSQCGELEDIILPDSLQELCLGAFSGCGRLSYVSLGAGVSKISAEVFRDCYQLTYFKIPQNNPHFSTDKMGVLYNKDQTILVLMAPGFAGEYTVLPGTQTIGDTACHSVYGLTAIHFPDSLRVIGDRAFLDCEYLQEAVLPEGLLEIRSMAFSSCFRLKKVTIPASVQTILAGAFQDCEHLETIIFLGKRPAAVNAIFSDCKATVYYPADDPSWDPLPTNWGNGLYFVPLED